MKKIIILAAAAILAAACVTQKSRSDISPVKKFYHDLNSEFNGYFNAGELYDAAILTLEEQHSDNYNKLLPIYAYAAADNPQSVTPDMDEAIKKVTVIRALHEHSHWIDDCYLMAGKAQFLKQDFETAEETLRYMVDQFSPEAKLKKGSKKKSGGKAKSKPVTQAQKKAQQKEKEQAQKDKAEERKEKVKTRKQEQKEKEKAYKKRKRDRKKELKAKKKAKKKGIKPTRRPTEVIGDDEPETPKVSKEVEDKIEDAAKKAEEEAEKKKREAKLAKEIEKGEKDKPFKHRSAHQEGQLWLARTYIERDKFEAATYLINSLDANPNLYKDIAEQLAALKGHFFIKRKEYDKAIAPLELAKKLASKRITKARYAYILAQLHQQKNETSKAMAYFEEVIKLKPVYEMDFSARLSMTLSDYHTGGMGVESAIKLLEKMLKDEKNIDYKDRIYFAMSEIYLKGGQEEDGIAFLKKALEEGGGNNAQKAEALVKLAYLFYEEQDYVKAADYFGQALGLLPKTDDRYDDMERLNNTIADIAKNIEMVSLQDSLLRISRMSNDEKRAIAYEIRQQQEKERLDRIKNANNSAGKFGPAARPSARPGGVNGLSADGSKSNFFAYDERAVKRGKRSFDREWGGRLLEDDWRRSSRQSASISNSDKEGELASNRLTDEEVATILRGVPQSQKQMEGAENTLADALFELGVLYRERLQNYTRSVATFEDLLERFPEYNNRAEAYYYLYLSYQDLGSNGKASQYEDKLKKEFPDSIFTQVLTDPNYLARINAEEMRLTNYYNAVYANFTSDEYELAYDSLKQVQTKFGSTNPLQPRFALLTAMTLGKLEGKEAYVRSLKDVVAKYPNTDEQRRAREILRLLGTNVGTIPGGGNETSEESLYQYEPDKLHYLIIVLNASATLNDIKINVSDYNRKYHSQDKLRISNIYLDNANGGGERTPLVVVRRFKTADDVMRYYDGVQKNKKDFIENTPYELYPITQTNYREILRNKSLEGYNDFFEMSYLNR